MIAVDTSALLAILFNEAERDSFRHVIESADRALICSASVIEARMVAHSQTGERLVEILDGVIVDLGLEVVPMTIDELQPAHEAFVRFGKGSGHPAQLNFGDLFSYALAKTREIPLLFKGNDFARTDIEPAVPPE